MNVTVHAAETTTEHLLGDHLPLLLRTAGDVSADWALWEDRPHVETAAERERDRTGGAVRTQLRCPVPPHGDTPPAADLAVYDGESVACTV